MPSLAELRNVYWDRKSVRLVNGAEMELSADDWLPAAIPAASPTAARAMRVDFPSGETMRIRPASANDYPALPRELRLAVVLDRSRSMAAYAEEVEQTFAHLVNITPDIDVYLTASPLRGEPASRVRLQELDTSNIVYYGGQNAAELFAQFNELHTQQAYSAILILTDGTGYKLDGDEIAVSIPDAPVWMVHLGGDLPLGYDDATLQAIQASGGGVSGGIAQALERLAVALNSDAKSDVLDGYVWEQIDSDVPAVENEASLNSDDPFVAFAARRLILAEMYRQRDALDKLENLDHLHALAKAHSIVTPYSSMIVLVNTQQERLLDELEQDADRFLREHEDVGDTAANLDVTGVPEPEEWLLMALAAGLLAWYTLRKR
jgi:putative PEP-CTERM system integral membrane protein